jgi:hypothetical protein
VRRPFAQYTSNFETTACSGEKTTESHSAISSTFHNDVKKQNPYRFKNLRRRPEPTPASLLSPSYNIPYLSKAVMAVS